MIFDFDLLKYRRVEDGRQQDGKRGAGKELALRNFLLRGYTWVEIAPTVTDGGQTPLSSQ